ncbi:MAG TPA: nucleotidyltransferase domain-containing protein [Firmicutes bacterium]|nr:nucleotidyltransferase domain-containing protein [Candidatus Fermentithermobacillaceae bacterium]
MSGRTEKIDIDECIPSLVKYLDQQEDVLAAMIYGSYGTEFQTPLSDVDLAILFYRDRKPSVERLLALEAGIVAICREDDINVLCLNDVDVMLQFRVIETGRLIFQRDPVALSDFREYVFKIYGDFAPFYRQASREYDKSLREAYVRDRPRQGQG